MTSMESLDSSPASFIPGAVYSPQFPIVGAGGQGIFLRQGISNGVIKGGNILAGNGERNYRSSEICAVGGDVQVVAGNATGQLH